MVKVMYVKAENAGKQIEEQLNCFEYKLSVVLFQGFNSISGRLSGEYRPHDYMLSGMIIKASLQEISLACNCAIQMQLSLNSEDPNQICYLGHL